MKEIFKDPNTIKVLYYKSILDSAGILSMVKNETIAMTEIPIPAFYPALCVMNDEDEERAIKILRDYQAKEKETIVGENIVCGQCSESNPANFEICWSCSAELK